MNKSFFRVVHATVLIIYLLFLRKKVFQLLVFVIKYKPQFMAALRIQKQKQEIFKNPAENWMIVEIPNPNKWIVSVQLFKITQPFHTVPFRLVINFPENYPVQSPQIRPESPHLFYHPNIDHESGYVCQETLKKQSIGLKIRDRIEAFITLLYIPNCNSPLNPDAATMYSNEVHKYYKNAFMVFRGISKMS